MVLGINGHRIFDFGKLPVGEVFKILHIDKVGDLAGVGVSGSNKIDSGGISAGGLGVVDLGAEDDGGSNAVSGGAIMGDVGASRAGDGLIGVGGISGKDRHSPLGGNRLKLVHILTICRHSSVGRASPW